MWPKAAANRRFGSALALKSEAYDDTPGNGAGAAPNYVFYRMGYIAWVNVIAAFLAQTRIARCLF